MSDEEIQTVPVQIFGEEYVIRTDQDEEHTRKCAAYVDEAIEDAHLRGHVSEAKAAILAAMEIADELLRLREDREIEDRQTALRLRQLRRRMEESLDAGD